MMRLPVLLGWIVPALGVRVTVEPWQSLHEAQTRARRLSASEVWLTPGTHRLNATLTFGPEDDGTTWRGAEGASISGGVELGAWRSCEEPKAHLLCAPVDFPGAQSRHLFVNGRRAARGRASSDVVAAFADPVAVDDDKYTVTNRSGAATWEDPSSVELVFTGLGSPWTESRCTLLNVSAAPAGGDLEVRVKQPCFRIVQHKPCGQGTSAPAALENLGPDALRAGEWYFSTAERTAYLCPLDDAEASGLLDGSAVAVMPVLETLVSAIGATDLSFSGLTFEHATWSRPSEGLGYVEQQSGALVDRPAVDGACNDTEWPPMAANVVFNASRRVTLVECVFRRLGATAVYFTGGSQGALVNRTVFADVSGAGVQIGDYDTFAEPDPAKRETGNVVTDSLFDGVAAEFHGNAAVSVGYSAFTTISHVEVRNLSYSGISIGWGWSRETRTYASNNTVERNRVRDFKQLLGDGGGIYALGPQQGSRMRYNHVEQMAAGAGGGGYYPDEGSAYWEVAHNVFSGAAACSDDCEWLHLWNPSIHDVSVHDCFTDTATEVNVGTDCPEWNITVVTDGAWPPEAQEIMNRAGTLSTAFLETQLRA